MHLPNKMMIAVCVAALLSGATFSVRAQETPAAQAETPAAAAQTEASSAAGAPTDVVATVGGEAVTEAELAIAGAEFGAELEQVPAEQRRSVLIDALVNMKLLAQAAQDSGLGEGPQFEARLQFLRMQALRNAYVEREIVAGLGDADVEKAYQELVVAQHKPEEQVRARHILVDTEDTAKKIISDLQAGADFAELAKQSKDPSGQNGGDLGFFGRKQMVPEFETAAFALEPGAVTPQPVKSQFGWHVIKVEEKRQSEPPALQQVEAELRQHVLRGKFESAMAELRTKYPVEITGAPAAPADPDAGSAATEAPAASGPSGSDAAPAGATDGQQQN